MKALDEKIKTITDKKNIFKTKMSELKEKINTIEKEKRKNNLVFFGIKEIEKTENELVDYIKEAIIDTEIRLNSHEIGNVYRIGQQTNNKIRPVVVSITTIWKKHNTEK